ncbi:LacI family transcriptional regulator [Aestuariicella hydrocarbonica]|uniref:LacI family transcriptional regulator n=1 Tax=Pseudomaricurvus hydrocarbonicus TaxID=1470433 RepID=A0A9E5T3P1_9GAMM|nr:LacI family DNA-binding transcriptional regulator [Aestuariicella hydrocarbonica]NHO67338.1 LacI family transcriptional regulator [Aestuariicella hydrocarbonica]
MDITTTIEDVANLAGVSIKTVSRVVNMEPNVRPATRERVQDAIRELGYQPNPSARGLASKRSYLVGLFYDDLMAESTYIVNVQRGVLTRCRKEGYELLIHPFNYHQNGINGLAEEITANIIKSRIDGVILTPPLSDLSIAIETLKRLDKPQIRLSPGHHESGSPCVYSDDRIAARLMTEHLIQLGHKRIAFIAGHSGHLAIVHRQTGFIDAMTAAGLNIDNASVSQGSNTFESGVKCAREILSHERAPTAIFASTDEMAAGVMSVAHQLGYSIPGDLSVAGYDNSQIAHQVWPALTTIAQPVNEMAEIATGLLIDQLRGGKKSISQVAMQSELVLRDSTGPAPC